MEYSAGNISDKIKTQTLGTLVRGTDIDTYIECHSGEGQYRTADGCAHKGTALVALEELARKETPFKAYLHEIRSERRNSLRHYVARHPMVDVRKNWMLHWADYAREANEKTCVTFDPCAASDYVAALPFIDALLEKDAQLFLYVPEMVQHDEHKALVEGIATRLLVNARIAVDLRHPAGNTGAFRRIDHNIVVGPRMVLERVVRDHDAICNQLLPPGKWDVLPRRHACKWIL